MFYRGKRVMALMSVVLLIAFGFQPAAGSGAVSASAAASATGNSVSSDSSVKSNGKVICIDPGHSSRIPSGTDPLGPGSSVKKASDNTGTAGNYTGYPEYKFTLSVSKKLKTELEKRGYRVVMTRTNNTQKRSCRKRAEIANKAKADAFIRIHADSSVSSSPHGISMQAPALNNPYIKKSVLKKSRKLSRSILKQTCRAAGAKNLGVNYRNDLSGNNWSKVPVTLIECGFMSNPREDRLLKKSSYQKKLARGIADGIDDYFGY